MSKKSISSILKSLKIDETFTKPTKKPKVFTKIKDTVAQLEDYNFMSDILVLPTTKEGFNALLVVVDLATRECDFEPIKNKKPETILDAFKKMLTRPHLKKPFSSVATDGGSEFKSVFDSYLKENKIFHKVAIKGRHTQQSMVESLNRTLGRLLNGYMNSKEEEKKEAYNEWTDVVDLLRTELNEIRKVKELPDIFNLPAPSYLGSKPKFKEGDFVYYQLDYPENALGKDQPTAQWREGDYRWNRQPKKIIKVLYMSGKLPYRYLLEGMERVSYTEAQLRKADVIELKPVEKPQEPEPPKEEEEKFEVEEIIGRYQPKNKELSYRVWLKNEPKTKAIYYERQFLVDKGLKKLLDDYDKKNPMRTTRS
jgi:hypothetical protein